MRVSRTLRLGAAAAIGALALTGWLAPAWGKSASPASGVSRVASTRSATPSLAADIAAARQATAKYAFNLAAAKAAGYMIITKMIPSMGYHFLNPAISGFNVRKPPILVYEHVAGKWQLGALEWVFTSMPKNPPLPNATFGFFPAACHYADGNFIPHANAATCPKRDPASHAKFTFWHPNLITMHVWIWYPNPDGLYASMNPLVAPFNRG
jgi:hypothetical protein